MVTQNPKLFSSTNNNYVHNFSQPGAAGKGTYVGMCGGLSTLWLLNMLNGVKDISSAPDEGRAQLIQVKYRWDADYSNDIVNLIQSVGLKGAAGPKSVAVADAAEQMATHGGAFLIWNGPHFVAAFIQPGKFYFYDCESGCYLFDNKADWKAQINTLGYGTTYAQPWSNWTVTK